MEGNTQKETNPIIYVLGTLAFVGVGIASYLLGMKNPLELSLGKPKTTPTPYVVPTEKPVQGIYDEYPETFVTPTSTATASSKPKVSLKPLATINPNIFFLPTPTPTIKGVILKTIAPVQLIQP